MADSREPTNWPIDAQRRFGLLCQRYLDDESDGAEARELSAALESRQEARRLLVDMALQRRLFVRILREQPHDRHAAPAVTSTAAGQEFATGRSPILGFLAESAVGQFIARGTVLFWLVAIVTNVLLVFGMSLALSPNLRARVAGNFQAPAQSKPVSSEGTVVATLVAAVDCQWEETAAAPVGGAELTAGMLRLKSGVAAIEFRDGAEVALRGPSHFELKSAAVGSLHVGKLRAHVSQRALGFTIETPSTRVVDLGTDFEVEVREQGDAEVRVLKGQIETTPVRAPVRSGTGNLRLSAGEGARFSTQSSAVTRLSSDEQGNFRPVARHGLPALGTNVVDQPHLDQFSGCTYVCSLKSSARGRAGEFNFYSRTADRFVTPLLLSLDERQVYSISGIGASLKSDGTGEQVAPFRLVAGSDRILPGVHFLGFFDGQVEPDGKGDVRVVQANQGTISGGSNPGQFGPWLYSLDDHNTYLSLGRKYSPQKDANGEITILEGRGDTWPGRFYSARLTIEPIGDRTK